VVRKRQEQDLATLVPSLQALTEPQQRLFLLTVALVGRSKGDGLFQPVDADVAEAAAALCATYETAAKGVIYEHRAGSVPAERLASEWRAVFDELGRSRPSAFALEAAAVLRQLEQRAREMHRVPGVEPRAFIALAGRIARQFQDGREASHPGAAVLSGAASGGLVLP
jgi:hypothetical protein